MRLVRETGLRMLEGVTRHNLGETQMVLGDLDGALEHLEAAASLKSETGRRQSLGYTKRALGDGSLARGDEAAAAKRYDEALAIARDANAADIEAEALVGIGRVHLSARRVEAAIAALSDALAIARRIDEQNALALSAAILSALPGGDPAAAAKELAELGDRPWHVARMEARWWLWKATHDRAHLAESWRLLRHLRDHAPEENRVTVIENVPLHRELSAAAKES